MSAGEQIAETPAPPGQSPLGQPSMSVVIDHKGSHRWFIRALRSLRNFRLRRFGRRFLQPRIAVFIDADNVHQHGIRSVLPELEKNWNATVRRAYGRNLASHADFFRQNGILPVEVVPNSPGKNGTDIALIVDAMDELHSGRVEAICLVSSDGDFTRMAFAIREHGIPVIAFGGPATPASLRNACTEFHFLPGRADARTNPPKSSNQEWVHTPTKRTPFNTREDFAAFVRGLMQSTGRMTVQMINHYACKRDATFSPRRLGANSLKALLPVVEGIELHPVTNAKGAIKDYEVRLSNVSADSDT